MKKEDESEKVVVRFAPSPTGFLHLGSARTALFNALFARQRGGTFILRIEDTDTSRNEKKYEESIMSGLSWLGINHDAIYRQSERGGVYREHLEKMIDTGDAYIAKEETGERSEVIRFRNPGKDVTFTDLVRGEVTMNTADLGDFVIARDLESPLYHLAVSVDDAEMEVTHVIRGDDGISNTPRQILIQEAMGATRPVYAHIPLILGPDRSKLSKRHGAASVDEYRDHGYLPEAMNNFLAFLGWNPGTEQEVFTYDELITAFDISKVGKGGAIFNEEKLKWFNREHMNRLSKDKKEKGVEEILLETYDASKVKACLSKITPLLLERISVWNELRTMVDEGEVQFYFEQPEYDAVLLLSKKDYKKATNDEEIKKLREETLRHLEELRERLNDSGFVDENRAGFTKDVVKDAVWSYAEEKGKGAVLWPMRVALSGRERSPDPFALAEFFGAVETERRLEVALSKLAGKL